MTKYPFLLFVFIFSFSCKPNESNLVYQSDYLEIIEIRPSLFIHISFLEEQDNSKISCNGMIYFNDNEAVIFDTPTNDISSSELITWIETDQNKMINHVIINHYHIDCLGGLKKFQNRDIKSYANQMTIDLAVTNEYPIPENTFDKMLISKVGKVNIITEFLGEAHSKDNTISYIPSEKVLFGGCMIKSLGAGKGNVLDANLAEWANTVERIKQKYHELEVIVPGHGKYGNKGLFDYTIKLFKE